jgi:hypothetical protein
MRDEAQLLAKRLGLSLVRPPSAMSFMCRTCKQPKALHGRKRRRDGGFDCRHCVKETSE